MGVLITRETDYALRILRHLEDGKKHLTSDVADACLIPLPFTYKIIKKLRDADLIKATRGANGGIEILADYYTTSVLDVLDAMEERPLINECLCDSAECSWAKEAGGQYCHVHIQLRAMQNALVDQFAKLNLAEFLFKDGKPKMDKDIA